jgi:hypothetical protein
MIFRYIFHLTLLINFCYLKMTRCYYQLHIYNFVIYFNILGELVIITLYCTSSVYSVFFMTFIPPSVVNFTKF